MTPRKPDEPIGYTFNADIYCDVCVLAVVARKEGVQTHDAAKLSTWEILKAMAFARKIDLEDEWTYDSNDFPKAIWGWMEVVPDERCGLCRHLIRHGTTDEVHGRWIP